MLSTMETKRTGTEYSTTELSTYLVVGPQALPAGFGGTALRT